MNGNCFNCAHLIDEKPNEFGHVHIYRCEKNKEVGELSKEYMSLIHSCHAYTNVHDSEVLNMISCDDMCNMIDSLIVGPPYLIRDPFTHRFMWIDGDDNIIKIMDEGWNPPPGQRWC